jgi:hypothetical protein
LPGARFCLTDRPGFNPRGIPAGGVGFNSLYRVVGSLGIQLRFPSLPTGRRCGFQGASVRAFGDPSDRT